MSRIERTLVQNQCFPYIYSANCMCSMHKHKGSTLIISTSLQNYFSYLEYVISISDRLIPQSVQPVVILQKESRGVNQIYTLPTSQALTNIFRTIAELLNICVFQSDTVCDTTMNGKHFYLIEKQTLVFLHKTLNG